MVAVGKAVPDLRGASTTGEIRLRELRGRSVVVYFYPKDATPGCTREAQDFRDLAKAFAKCHAIVLGVSRDSLAKSVSDLGSGLRVSTEYPNLTRRYFASHGIEAEVQLSYGATEAKIPEIADAVVEITETGRALHAAGLRILDTILVSHTELLANKQAASDPVKRHGMEQLYTLLSGSLAARKHVLLKLNVGADDVDKVIALLPAMKSPTMAELFGHAGYAVEAVVPRKGINTLIPALSDAGATAILEIPLSKIVP